MKRIVIVIAAALLAAGCGKKEAPPPQPTAAQQAAQQSSVMAHQHEGDAPDASPAAQQGVAPGTVVSQTVVYGNVDGRELKGYLTKPAESTGPLPGVLVFHEWWGLNDNIRSMADQLAAQGYEVLAADLYGGRAATTPDDAKSLMAAALGKPQDLSDNITAAYHYLKEGEGAGRIGTLGWCFGGSMSYLAGQALSGDVKATVIYYGFVNDHKDELAKLKAPVLGFFGGKDGGIPAATVEGFAKGLEAAGNKPQIKVYPEAGHAFANPSGKAYRKDDAEDAWKQTLEFLNKNLKGI